MACVVFTQRERRSRGSAAENSAGIDFRSADNDQSVLHVRHELCHRTSAIATLLTPLQAR